MIHDCSFVLCWCSWVPCLFWTVELSTVLQNKSSTFCRFCSFPAFLHIWTLSSSDCMILRSIFSHWGQLRDSNTTIKKVQHSLMLQKEHDALRAGCWNFGTGWRFPTFFLLWNIYFFPFYYCPSEATEDTCMFPGRQIKYNLPWSSNSKVFTPRLLMHRVSFWSISECLNLF